MAERAEPIETPEPRSTSEPITDVTRWGLLGDIYAEINRESGAVLEAGRFQIDFGDSSAAFSLTDSQSKKKIYFHIDLENRSYAEISFSRGAPTAPQHELGDYAGRWLRGLIAEGIRNRGRS